MKPLSETLTEMGIAFSFPIEIKDVNGKLTYYEDSKGWGRAERDANGNITYHENDKGYWYRYEFDAKGNSTYYEDSDGYNNRWSKNIPNSMYNHV